MFSEIKLKCNSCGTAYSAMEQIWRCTCNGFLELDYQKSLSIEKLKGKDWNYWRYDSALPIQAHERRVTLGEPCTPLVKVEIDGRELLLKMESLNPTGSFKDRGSAMMINAAVLREIVEIIEDSSGNAGSSVAAYAAASGIKANILVPASTSENKIGQISAFGANLMLIEGDRQATADRALELSEKFYYASHCWDPFFIEGVKTIAFEIAEQLHWKVPDEIFSPVGNGSLILGIYKGFSELVDLGVIERVPRLIAVQAQNCSPIFQSWSNIGNQTTISRTVAEGIAVPSPVRKEQIINTLKLYGGEMVTVSEAEIKAALKSALKIGIMMEPTSGVALAAAIKSRISQGEVVVPVTGNGLKAVKPNCWMDIVSVL